MDVYTPEVLIKEEEINLRVQEIGHQITRDYSNSEVIIICVLKGAFVFCADLIKHINLPLKVEFVALSSYGDGTESSGEVKMDLDITGSLRDKNIIIVEDIVDTGLTLASLMKQIELRDPRSVALASLLYKPSKCKADLNINYLAFEIEDKFVIGYGLDYAGRYRELPYIGILNAGH